MKMHLETITPRKAADWLKRNINNRPMSEKFVQRLADAMTASQWQVNGDPIRFDSSGDLIDGQHRLTAVIKSGVSIESWVLRGVESTAFDTIDKGHVRTNGDVLARRGEKYYNILAAAASLLFRYDAGVSLEYGRNGTPRPDELDDILQKHGDRLRSACEFAVHNKSPLIPASEVSFLVAVCDKLYGREATCAFWSKVISAEDLRRGSPEHLLHKRLTESLTGNTRLLKKARMAICVKAFNAYMAGQQIKCLKFIDGEDFPEFLKPSKVKANG
jgi:hypothetical protein